MIRSHMSNNKVIYPFDHAVMWSHVTNEFHYVFFEFPKTVYSLSPLNFCIIFINFAINICVDQVALKIRVLNQDKNSRSALQ